MSMAMIGLACTGSDTPNDDATSTSTAGGAGEVSGEVGVGVEPIAGARDVGCLCTKH